jgi:group I intron endonuclease
MYCIYAIVNSLDDKIYIGYTKEYKTRMKRHFNEKTWKKYHNVYLYRAMKCHGKENFYHLIIDYCETKEIAKKTEIYYIAFFKKLNFKLYNMTDGGEDGSHLLNPLNTETEKHCFDCKTIKPNSDFSIDNNTTWGYARLCRACAKIRATEARNERNGPEGYVQLGWKYNTNTEKYCSHCKKTKSFKEFNKSKNQKNGLDSICRDCQNKEHRIKTNGADEYKLKGKQYNTDTEKYCSRCDQVLPRTKDFYFSKKQNKFTGCCIQCELSRK